MINAPHKQSVLSVQQIIVSIKVNVNKIVQSNIIHQIKFVILVRQIATIVHQILFVLLAQLITIYIQMDV